ncbi:MAG: RNA-binding transcriptional accessory protein [Clostridiales bacterium]|nr:RNA-binding transcriptional accessory protein [Clostridiales bacterium]
MEAKRLAEQFNIQIWQAENVIDLIDEGNTIPFIARYRKEKTGSLDDQILREFSERLIFLRKLEEMRQKVLDAIEKQGNLTEEISVALENAQTLTEIEDIYRPFRPKRKTRASVAKEKGLEPLAEKIYLQTELNPYEEAKNYINQEKGVETEEDALQGARDIIAEKISDDAEVRKRIRYVCYHNGDVVSRSTKEDSGVYEMYKEFSEPVSKIAGHRVLALNRGEKEEFLKVSVDFNEQKALNIIKSIHILGENLCSKQVLIAAEDAYKRLIFPAIEREIRNELTEKATESAIKVFGVNLRQLLMQPPIKNKITLGLDPGYRTGCKVAVVDETGKVLDTSVIYATLPNHDKEKAKTILKELILKHKVNVIAIGNGTASHETEVLVADILGEMKGSDLSYMVVSEAGASVYSASPLAAKEFPDYDVSLRSAVSIARRLQDPLAELVKIEPKAIGVGQYQHDMPPAQLDNTLEGVVEDCVNNVGVDVNTASPRLLSFVAGIGETLAKNIVAYREENGKFTSRAQFKKIQKLGPKAFEQCAGFLRIAESKNVLENTAVHPESYEAAQSLLEICGYDIKKDKEFKGLYEKAENIGIKNIAQKLQMGEPTLLDIIKELEKPGRDIRDELPPPMLKREVLGMEDLKPGMEIKGTVRNIIDFGAFVDIGVHQDGLVHISQITDRYIKHPMEVLKVGQVVTVWVISVDVNKKRIALTMKKPV